MKQTVMVWRKAKVVSVYQKSKSVWIAAGDYMDEHIEVKARTKSAAVAHWQEAARYKGN
jgi:hypothetical protein